MLSLYHSTLRGKRWYWLDGKPKESIYFHYLNLNPHGNNACDCVIRSICLATGAEWDDLYVELSYIGFKKKRILEEPLVFREYLKKHGFKQKKVAELPFSKLVDLGKLSEYTEPIIIEFADHVSCAKIYRGRLRIHDSWDCSNYKVQSIWIKKS